MHISLYQFKHYADQVLELGEHLQVVVGNNGSGKSTLCEALSIIINASNPHHTNWEGKSTFDEKTDEWALRLQIEESLFQCLLKD